MLENISSRKPVEVNACLGTTPLDIPLHPDLSILGECRLGLLFQLSRQRLNDAIINSHDRCFTAIEDYIEHHNANDARPFRWSKKSEDFGEEWNKGIGSSKKGNR